MGLTINKNSFELLGIMLGDGCLSRSGGKYIIYISGHKKDDLEYHQSNSKLLFNKVFNKEISVKFRRFENTLFIRFSDKKIFEQFKSWGIPVGKKYSELKIPQIIFKDKHFLLFMKGLFDTDGCLIYSKQHRKYHYYPRIEITSKSKNFLREILIWLKKIGFYGSISFKGRGYRLELPGFKNLELWTKLIGSNNPKHLNKFQNRNPKLL
ncbi:MAG: LAGLIDADG family homing endonuclease [Candidatus Woesearchaeota archaeon]